MAFRSLDLVEKKSAVNFIWWIMGLNEFCSIIDQENG